MIANPSDDWKDKDRESPAYLAAELRRIETANGQLDRHPEPPPKPVRGLDALRVPSLDAGLEPMPRRSWVSRVLAALLRRLRPAVPK